MKKLPEKAFAWYVFLNVIGEYEAVLELLGEFESLGYFVPTVGFDEVC